MGGGKLQQEVGKMALIVALKYKNGSILATDTRVMYDEIKRDEAGKLEFMTDEIGVAAFGLIGATDDILKPVKDNCKSDPTISFDKGCRNLSDNAFDWYKKYAERLDEDESYGFILVSPDRIKRIDEKGYSEEAYDYECEGDGRRNGEYLLREHFKKDLGEEEAKRLAVFTILETSKIDPTVGNDIQMAVFPKKEKYKLISNEEIENIKVCVDPMHWDVFESRIKTLKDIIEMREKINNLWEKIFGFKLFLQNEKAVFQIMVPCRNETEFNTNILALALLTDQLNIKGMKKYVTAKDGSINYLERFLTEKIKKFPPEIISNLRDIRIMRSWKFPVHPTDPKFIKMVYKITGDLRYPPHWPELYSKSLDMYKESLSKLLDCLQDRS